MTDRTTARLATWHAAVTGLAIGCFGAAGITLLIYTGDGLLQAAGVLAAATVLALAAGLWAGTPQPGDVVDARRRFTAAIALLILAGAFSRIWFAIHAVRDHPAGGASAVLLLLGLPAYATGTVLAALQQRGRAGIARRAYPVDGIGGIDGVDGIDAVDSVGGTRGAAALAGAAVGVLLATGVLISKIEPWGLYYACAAVVSLTAISARRADAGAAAARGASAQEPAVARDVAQQVVLVTGAGDAGQLGYAIARHFMHVGARVVVTARGAAVNAVASDLGVHGVVADLDSNADVARLIDEVCERHGRLDVLVNTAGGLRLFRSLAATGDAEWQAELQRNAGTALRVSRAAIPALREARGIIVNFASPAVDEPVRELGAYAAAKAAVVSMTRTLALEEEANGVRVFAISPDMLDTVQNRVSFAGADPQPSFLSRDDVARTVVALATGANTAASGSVIRLRAATPG